MSGGGLQLWVASKAKRFMAMALGLGVIAAQSITPAQAFPVGYGPVSPGTDWIVMDATTGKILSQNNPFTERFPASLTKLMTLDLAFHDLRAGRLSADTAIPVTAAAANVQPVKLNLVPGQTITVRQAMLGMTTLSANDAATALGQYLGNGSISRAAAAMTERAHALGMLHTQFYNPSGLPNPGQVTDAYDMAVLARHILLTYPQYRYLFSVASFMFEGRPIPNIDGMLKLYPGAIGMKTGYTDLARFNLVTAAVRDGHMLIGVELHARGWSVAYHTMAHLLDQGFAAEGAGTGPIIAFRKALPAIMPTADAATIRQTRQATHPQATHPMFAAAAPIRQPAARRVLVTVAQRHVTIRNIVMRSGHVTQDMIPGWTAQIGAYDNYAMAKRQALLIHAERHVGTARVSSVLIRHRRVWRAQLAGLNEAAAHATCTLLQRRHQSCFLIGPRQENLAMR
ncbi:MULTISPECIES: D-alanyl-D-alanine carboxypeptidase family protein [Acidiphilium]|uniref:D-alanyl-D-alanine carboxypeptidase n=1 Tax=Acidiphilium rubrum TaxID=526 RepID=A0A8G2CKM6_ACIRU|nr:MULTISPECIES: D-alanyl-D-alanine carboxypeptidase family protein [Acidiphilium]MBW4036206.1 D-alanyl-D-alanine carboxypeptidase [Pseudomonadota bacterium]SIQ81531.1 D-alanyl-D-alanine carboxypeptidase [Acidiphilium rubrum]